MRRFVYIVKIILLVPSVLAMVIFALLFIRKMIKLESVRVALPWLNQAQFAGMYVADVKGFYRDEGIAVNLLERDLGGATAVSLLKEGKADIAIMSAGNFLRAANDGEEIVALAAVFQTSPTVIVSLEKARIKSPKDLMGKKIGLSIVNQEAKLPLLALLEEADVPENSVTLSGVGSNQVDALLRGDVDAVSVYRINELYELDKKNVPYSLLFPERFGVDMYGDIIVVRKKYLLSHIKEVGGFLRATFKGWKFAEQDSYEAVRITLQADNPKYHDVAREEYILKNALKMIRLAPKQVLGQMVPLQWNYMYALFQKHGIVDEVELENFFIDVNMYQKLGFPEFFN